MRPPTATRAGTRDSSRAREDCSFLSFFKLAPQATAGGPGPMRASLFNIVLPLPWHTHTHTHTHTRFRTHTHVLHGFGLDYVKCFDLIPQSIVLHIALEQGMDPGTHRALKGMYTSLVRCFKIMGCCASFFAATNAILQGCPLSVILINLMTSI